MVKEYYSIKSEQKSINISASQIDSLRNKDVQRGSVRIFNNGKIGISASASGADFAKLEASAIENLKLETVSGYDLPENSVLEREFEHKSYDDSELIGIADRVLNKLRYDHPEFVFSGNVSFESYEKSLKNSAGTDLKLRNGYLDVSIIFKSKKSAGIMDGYFGNLYQGDMDFDEFCSVADDILSNYDNELDIEEGKIDVVFQGFQGTIMYPFFYKHLNGELIEKGASYFSSGRSGFCENFSLYDVNDMSLSPSPFDADGLIRKDPKLSVIDRGRLVAPLFDIRKAVKYGKKPTGTSVRSYNGATHIAPNFLMTNTTDIKLKDFEKALLVIMTSGGDFQDDGSLSMPVQLAYIVENGKIKGKAPQLILHNTIENIFGLDYIGTLNDRMYENDKFGYFASKMILKKG